MLNLRMRTLGIVLLAAAAVLPAMGQGVATERLNFTISAPFRLKKSDVVLPAGKYYLSEVNSTEGTEFWLFSDLKHKPLALIETVRYTDETSIPAPDKTEVLLDTTTPSDGEVPVLDGWKLPGGEGWEVTATVPDKKEIERQAQEQMAGPEH